MTTGGLGNIHHWDAFYASNLPLELLEPSPFAKLVVARIPLNTHIIDVGCGNGRDSIFFKNNGYAVIALDGSSSAIQTLCQNDSRFTNNQNAFILNFEDVQENKESTHSLLLKLSTGNSAIYARFFLHAISEVAQKSFFDWVAKILRPGEFIFLEYRSPHANDYYSMGSHFRRPIEARTVSDSLTALGFEILESDSSKTFAPFRSDNTMISRTIARKTLC